MADIKVNIGADASQFDRVMSSVTGKMDGLKKVGLIAAQSIAAIGAAAVVAVTATAALATKLALMAETAKSEERGIRSIIQSMGLFAGKSDEVAQKLNDQAGAWERLTGQSGDQINSAQQALLTFRGVAQTADTMGGAFDRAWQAALDMSSVLGGDAKSYAIQLGKALEDPVNGLTALKRTGALMTPDIERIGAFFEKTGDKAKTYGMILEAVELQVKGHASSTAESSKRMAAGWSQLMEELGRPISDEIDKAMMGFEEGFGKMSGIIEKIQPDIAKVTRGMVDAVSTAVNGDSEKLLKIGMFIGELIKEGLKLALLATGTETAGMLLEGASKYTPMGFTARKLFGDEKYDSIIDQAQGYGRQQTARDAQGSLSRIRESYQNTFGYGDANAVIPGMRGTKFRFAQPGESSPFVDPATGFRIIEILQRVADNTAPSGRAFP